MNDNFVGTILEGYGSMEFQTDIKAVFDCFAERACEFDWWITDLLWSPWGTDDMRLSGGQLVSKIEEEGSFQMIWAVLSGFPPDLCPVALHPGQRPYADGNGSLWRPGYKPQHPDASVEVICWDSWCTILVTSDGDLTDRFRIRFPGWEDLDEYIASRDR